MYTSMIARRGNRLIYIGQWDQLFVGDLVTCDGITYQAVAVTMTTNRVGGQTQEVVLEPEA